MKSHSSKLSKVCDDELLDLYTSKDKAWYEGMH